MAGSCIDGVGVTQSRNLDGAEQMVRDYIESLTTRDRRGGEVTIKPEVGDGLDQATQAAREAVAAVPVPIRSEVFVRLPPPVRPLAAPASPTERTRHSAHVPAGERQR
jgi:hypothetical protein